MVMVVPYFVVVMVMVVPYFVVVEEFQLHA
jgi:hypothetical protein